MSALWRKSGSGGDSGARSRRIYWISGGATVVVLAAVMLAFVAFGPTRGTPSPPVKTIQLAQQQESQGLTQEAQTALQSGDTTAAAALATRALVIDPGNAQAKRLVETIKKLRAAPKPAPPTTPPAAAPTATAPATSPDEAFLGNVADIAALLPKSFAGYDLGQAVPTAPDAVVSGAPTAKSSKADRILWAVHQTESPADAKAFVTKTSKTAYGEDSADIKVSGMTGYFGTDGTRFATVVYVRGKYVFEVIATSNTAAPATLKDTATKAAEAFPQAFPG